MAPCTPSYPLEPLAHGRVVLALLGLAIAGALSVQPWTKTQISCNFANLQWPSRWFVGWTCLKLLEATGSRLRCEVRTCEIVESLSAFGRYCLSWQKWRIIVSGAEAQAFVWFGAGRIGMHREYHAVKTGNVDSVCSVTFIQSLVTCIQWCDMVNVVALWTNAPPRTQIKWIGGWLSLLRSDFCPSCICSKYCTAEVVQRLFAMAGKPGSCKGSLWFEDMVHEWEASHVACLLSSAAGTQRHLQNSVLVHTWKDVCSLHPFKPNFYETLGTLCPTSNSQLRVSNTLHWTWDATGQAILLQGPQISWLCCEDTTNVWILEWLATG